MDRATKIRNWALAVTATGAAIWMILDPVQASVRNLIAQEAKAVAEEAFDSRVAPLEKQFMRKIQLDRRADDRAELDICLKERVEVPEGDPRRRRCEAESDYRWALWGYQDCIDVKGEDDPTCVRPDSLPRLPSQRR